MLGILRRHSVVRPAAGAPEDSAAWTVGVHRPQHLVEQRALAFAGLAVMAFFLDVVGQTVGEQPGVAAEHHHVGPLTALDPVDGGQGDALGLVGARGGQRRPQGRSRRAS